MTSRERRTFFERLCGMREAYPHLDALDRTGITPMAKAMAEAAQELERIAAEAESVLEADQAANSHNPV